MKIDVWCTDSNDNSNDSNDSNSNDSYIGKNDDNYK